MIDHADARVTTIEGALHDLDVFLSWNPSSRRSEIAKAAREALASLARDACEVKQLKQKNERLTAFRDEVARHVGLYEQGWSDEMGLTDEEVVPFIADALDALAAAEQPVSEFPHVDPCACGHDHTVGREGPCGSFLCPCREWRERGDDA